MGTKTLIKKDRKYIWHPFTQMRDWQTEEVLVIDKGDGCYLIDTEGRRYLDGVSSLWCNVHGHRVKELHFFHHLPDGAVGKDHGRITVFESKFKGQFYEV